MSNNPPDKVVYLTEAQWAFALRNCEVNLEHILEGMMKLHAMDDPGLTSALENLVALSEQFSSLRKALKEAQ
jgi:hypothetical protein